MNFKIGDRIFVRGYIDEIRKDTVIVRNDGGYFGTVLSEVTGELPSAQPEKRTEERAETHACDLIDRQAAIKAIRKDMYADKDYMSAIICEGIENVLNNLPSAQPVLTCDGCKHIGTYDTDFPCNGCVRREKDYYDPE